MDELTVTVVGCMKSTDYHKAKCIVETLAQKHPQLFKEVTFEGLTQFQWDLRSEEIRQSVTNNNERLVAEEADNMIILANGKAYWTMEGIMKWVEEGNYLPDLQQTLDQTDFHVMCLQAYDSYIKESECVFVYMNISADDGKINGQITFQLFSQLCPKTVDNFVTLCQGVNRSVGGESAAPLSYAKSIVHRIIPNGWIQGGDIVSGSGTSGMSIYGQAFPDETYALSHDSAGVLGMANKGRNTNASQFYITLKSAPWMDGQYVAFGRVVEGRELLRQIETLETHNERPVKPCIISHCGLLKP